MATLAACRIAKSSISSSLSMHCTGCPSRTRPLRSIRAAMKPGGRAQLRLVPKGERKSLEDVLEDTRLSGRWARYFQDFHDPYLHLTPRGVRRTGRAQRSACGSRSHGGEGVGLPVPLCILRFRLGDLCGMDAPPYLRRKQPLSWPTCWTATDLSPPTGPAKKIPSSSIRWISRCADDGKTAVRSSFARCPR